MISAGAFGEFIETNDARLRAVKSYLLGHGSGCSEAATQGGVQCHRPAFHDLRALYLQMGAIYRVHLLTLSLTAPAATLVTH